MANKADDLKLFKVSGFYVKDFYLIAKDEEEATQEARGALTFKIVECEVDKTGQMPRFWKRLFGR